ncbi:tetratricopeptide repeat protein [Jannaschia ovalis]|uniref:Tetratricopeptide repeat protein n=1 Tax=Jannaschia ovalis TaxID=3038773 RepID=A0ABY8LFB0_9RHOB|nr:tetratricopeptide repeat protein [Jannaschia sp. GRR-S6-38]WGH79337.1 tetratricopeptide repeat protein [Jannaschia sp. GRR-S6-38]
MRHPTLLPLLLGSVLVLSACNASRDAEVARAIDAMETEEGGIRDIMLTVAEPAEAVAYFKRKTDAEPDVIAHHRGLARSLVRAGRGTEAVLAWREVTQMPDAAHDDSVELADALIRVSDWKAAEATLDAIPPTHETYKRYRLEAMVADSNRQWERADSFYETAVGLTTTPAGTLNNWGFSKLTRGDSEAAERLFTEAITYDDKLFTAKNNLVLARAARRTYTLPSLRMSQEERAQLMHTAGLAAIKQGDVDIGRSLLEDAIATHPRYFEPAVRALEALDA